jgi:hypothetical protein
MVLLKRYATETFVWRGEQPHGDTVRAGYFDRATRAALLNRGVSHSADAEVLKPGLKAGLVWNLESDGVIAHWQRVVHCGDPQFDHARETLEFEYYPETLARLVVMVESRDVPGAERAIEPGNARIKIADDERDMVYPADLRHRYSFVPSPLPVISAVVRAIAFAGLLGGCLLYWRAVARCPSSCFAK